MLHFFHENQFLLVSKLRQATTLVSMLSTLQPTVDERDEDVWSSSTLNNFQTLDIRHYMVLFNSPSARRELSGHFVPMYLRAPALVEVSDLGIELDPRHWRRRRKLADRIHSAVNMIHSGPFGHELECCCQLGGRLRNAAD